MIQVTAFFKVLMQPQDTLSSVIQTTTTTEALIMVVVISLIGALFTKQIVWLTRSIHNVWLRILVKWVKGFAVIILHVLFIQYAALLFGGTGTFHSNLVAWAYASVGAIILALLATATLLVLLLLFVLLLIPILLVFKNSGFSDPLIKLIAAVLGSAYAIFFVWWYVKLLTAAIQVANAISFWPALLLLVLPMLLTLPVVIRGKAKRSREPKQSRATEVSPKKIARKRAHKKSATQTTPAGKKTKKKKKKKSSARTRKRKKSL